METVKSKIFNYLTKAQKSDICHYISTFVKTRYDEEPEEILADFIEEERYYLEIDASRRPWIIDYLDDPEFYKDAIRYICENQRKYQYKEAQKPYIEKQKEYQKEQRKIARDRKMQREKPTPKQISYYKALCKKHKVDISSIDLENASKFDLRNAIDTLLTEEHSADKQKILSRLNEIIRARQNEE